MYPSDYSDEEECYFDDDYHSDGVDAVSDDDESGDEDDVLKNYTILDESVLLRRMEDDITELLAVLTVSKSEASILLLNYDWNASKLLDLWFADENQVRKSVGLLIDEKSSSSEISSPNFICGICFEPCTIGELNYSGICGHPFCKDCWSSYTRIAINDGAGCLRLRCPVPTCRAAVSEDMVVMFASDEEKQKFSRYLVRFYVEKKQNVMRWCPAADCKFAAEFDSKDMNLEVLCSCSHKFCANCMEEAHRPVHCETVRKWIEKNTSTAENLKWITAFTKLCPKCQKPIEKSQGCIHMTCFCSYEFCWLCLQEWKDHGYNECNEYKGSKNQKNDKQRRRTQKSIKRYTHYYERWANHRKSMKKAMKCLQKSGQIDIRVGGQTQNGFQICFLREAWEQIIECRRVLGWTYAYAYYLPEEMNDGVSLFKFLQQDAEYHLEKLHHCAEKELKEFLEEEEEAEFLEEEGESSSTRVKKFEQFRFNLINHTIATRAYLNNLVTALEKGFLYEPSNDDEERSMSESWSRRIVPEGCWKCKVCKTIYSNKVDKCGVECNYGLLLCRLCGHLNPRSETACELCKDPLQYEDDTDDDDDGTDDDTGNDEDDDDHNNNNDDDEEDDDDDDDDDE